MFRLLRLLLLIVSSFAATGLTACQKQTPAPNPTTAALLQGRWALTHTSGNFSGHHQPADSTQKEEIIFEPNGRAQFLLNGTVTTTAAFTLTKEVAAMTQQAETFLTYSAPATTMRQYIAQASTTTLVIRDDNPDRFSATYQRVPLNFCGTR